MWKRIWLLLVVAALLVGLAPRAALAADALEEEPRTLPGDSAEWNMEATPDDDAGLAMVTEDDTPEDMRDEPDRDIWPESSAADVSDEDAGIEFDLPDMNDTSGDADTPLSEIDSPIGDVYAIVTTEPDMDELTPDRGDDPWDGAGTDDDPFLLRTGEDFAALARRVNTDGADYAGCVFRMEADITLPGGWTPIGCVKPGASSMGEGANLWPFSGTLDGAGHTLSLPADSLPLFGFVRDAAVQNLNIYGPRIAGDGIVNNYCVDYNTASATVRFSNVTLKSGTQTLRSGFIGGLVDGVSENEYSQTSAQNLVYITNCTVEAGVVIGYDRSQSRIGSFAGQLNGSMSGSVSSASVYGVDDVGGLVGMKSASMGDFTVSDCAFHGSVTGSGKHVGGIVGSGYDHYTAPNTRAVCLLNCICDGTVSGGSHVGGILGSEGGLWQAWDNGIAYIRGNSFTGTVSGGSYVGGVIGYYRSLNRYTVIENNTYGANCGTEKGIGGVLYVDSSIYSNGNNRPLGWQTVAGNPDQVYCFDSSEDDIDRIKYALNRDSIYYNIARADHQRDDDPLGADASKLCSRGEATGPYTVEIIVTGKYKLEYLVGETLDLTGAEFTVKWSDGTQTHPALKDIKTSKLDTSAPGVKTVTVYYGTTSTNISLSVKNKDTKIKVTFSILGDYAHDSDADGKLHGLSMGGLSTWAPAAVYEVGSNDTVWDLMQKVMPKFGITAITSNARGTVYIVGLSRGGVTLSEFTNGVRSGWMYTVNGHHPLLGVAQQFLKDGDVIVFHYSDDYTREEGSEGYNDADEKAAAAVEKLIDAIGSPVTLESEKRIAAARRAYDALTSYTQRSKVKNYDKLVAAEKELEELKKAEAEKNATEEDKTAAAAVEKLIDALTGSDAGTVKAARDAYDRLTDLQKRLVKNLDKLEKAEAALAAVGAKGRYRDIYTITGDYIESLGDLDASSMWFALGLERSGRELNKDVFYRSVVEYVQNSINDAEQLHRAKSSDNSRTILALTAMGYDVTNVGGHNLLMGLTDLEYVKKQGINGPIWALIALDSHDYEIPTDPNAADQTTRERIIEYLLSQQLTDGGWALSGDMSDSDITGMCLQALAPYYGKREDVTQAADRALETLSRMQNADGSFSAFGSGEGLVPTSESISQVLVALSALGIDADTDPRFVKNGHSVVEALCAYFVEGGGFRHLLSLPLDGMATEQAYYALTAYFRMLDGRTSLYDMTDVRLTAVPATPVPMATPVPVEPSAAEEAEENEDVALAVTAAAGRDERSLSILWLFPPVLLAGAAAYAIDRNRRRRRRRRRDR